jgi:hypothetical protein
VHSLERLFFFFFLQSDNLHGSDFNFESLSFLVVLDQYLGIPRTW